MFKLSYDSTLIRRFRHILSCGICYSAIYSQYLRFRSFSHVFLLTCFKLLVAQALERLIHLRPFLVLIYRGAFHCRRCDFVSLRTTANYTRPMQLFRCSLVGVRVKIIDRVLTAFTLTTNRTFSIPLYG